MIRNRAVLWACVGFAVTALAIPPDVAHAAAAGAQHAGSISLILPKVELVRDAQNMPVQPPTPVYWGDVVNTEHMARARIKLDDGSVLNVGSDSSLTVVKHDASRQQTQIDVTFGEVRSKVVHLAKPGASFQVRTPTGVAGVVGTDFYMAYTNSITRLVVFQGTVKFCNLAGECVMVGAGMMSSIRGQNSSPDSPVQAPNQDVLDAGHNTQIKATGHGLGGFARAHPIWLTTIIAVAIAVPIAVVKTSGGSSTKPPTGTGGITGGRTRGLPPGN